MWDLIVRQGPSHSMALAYEVLIFFETVRMYTPPQSEPPP
jgi:hypothetical protein